MNKYIIIFSALVFIAIGYALYDMGWNVGYSKGEKAGMDYTRQLYNNDYPQVLVEGKPDTVYLPAPPIKGKAKVTTTVKNNIVSVDSFIVGQDGMQIRLLAEDASKGIEVYWTIPKPPVVEITRIDTIRTMVPVEIVVEKPVAWYETVYAGIGYGVAVCLGVFALVN